MPKKTVKYDIEYRNKEFDGRFFNRRTRGFKNKELALKIAETASLGKWAGENHPQDGIDARVVKIERTVIKTFNAIGEDDA